jgi:hypothetical protein
MSFRSDDVVVPFAVFDERRERRTRIAEALREANRSDVTTKGPVAVAATVARGQAPAAATEERE